MRREDIKVGGTYLFIFEDSKEDKHLDGPAYKALSELSGSLVTVSDVQNETCRLKGNHPAVYFRELYLPLMEDNV